MDVTLIEHAQDEVDDDDSREHEQWLARERLLEGLRCALECLRERAGHAEWRFACSIALTAALNATPGARLKLKVTAGNCPW